MTDLNTLIIFQKHNYGKILIINKFDLSGRTKFRLLLFYTTTNNGDF